MVVGQGLEPGHPAQPQAATPCASKWPTISGFTCKMFTSSKKEKNSEINDFFSLH